MARIGPELSKKGGGAGLSCVPSSWSFYSEGLMEFMWLRE